MERWEAEVEPIGFAQGIWIVLGVLGVAVSFVIIGAYLGAVFDGPGEIDVVYDYTCEDGAHLAEAHCDARK